MRNIDRNFVLAAFAWLLVGTLFGFWMGASNNTQFVGVHVALLLPGFVSLAIYGFSYRLWPRLKSSPLAIPQFWIAMASVPLLAIGSWHSTATGSIALIAPASAIGIAGAALMAWIFWRGTGGE